MVIENLKITPLAEWLLGAGWDAGKIWQTPGFAVLLIVLLSGGLGLLLALRRSSAAPGPTLSLSIGSVFGCLSLLAFVIVALCSTVTTRSLLDQYFAGPLSAALVPLLGTDWSDGALYTWIAVATGLASVVYAIGWLGSILVAGPMTGTRRCGRTVAEIAIDLARISPRRVYALAWLAVRDSIRRRVVVVFVAFLVLVLFAAFFLPKNIDHPGQRYIHYVLNWTIFLTMLFALVLSSLSLPADLRDRTLHTVVTKPVRKIEIVLGRVLGIVFVGTVLLAGIGLISYGFTVRSLNHTHQLSAEALRSESLPGDRGTILRGTTSRAHAHAHEVVIDAAGNATVELQKDHTHDLYVSGSGDKTTYTLSEPVGQLQARVPIYGTLSFLDDTGREKEKGINVGDEWTYRSFIKGQSAAAAIWTFKNLSEGLFPESKFPNGIPVEMTIEVFRTYKGNQEKGVAGTIWLRNPQEKTNKKVYLRNFLAKKFATDVQVIPRSFPTKGDDGKARQIDLFRDMVSDDGRLEIIVQCFEPQQYYGMAQADLYIRAADSSFAFNFFKGYVGIWLQMVLVVSLGVMFGTFLSGPVAFFATFFAIIVAIFSGHVVEIAGGKMIGGGPFESVERIMTQDNMVSELEPGMKTTTLKAFDQVTAVMMRYFSALIPNIADSDYIKYVADGFSVGRDLLTRCLLCEAAYLLPVILLGYVSLKRREIAG